MRVRGHGQRPNTLRECTCDLPLGQCIDRSLSCDDVLSLLPSFFCLLSEMRDYIHFNLQPRLHDVLHKWPYFNRSGGLDHLVVYVGDNGPIGDCMSHMDHAPVVREIFMSMVRVRDNFLLFSLWVLQVVSRRCCCWFVAFDFYFVPSNVTLNVQ